MGDIFRRADIWGLTENAKRLGHAPDTQVLVDPGATKSVISTRLAKRLRGKFLIDIPIEGRSVRTKLTAIRLNASNCGEQPVVVAVDDQLMRRAGNGPDGKPVDVLLGHEYLEAERAGIRYMERGDEVACQVAPLRRERGQVPPLTSARGQHPGKVVRRTRRSQSR